MNSLCSLIHSDLNYKGLHTLFFMERTEVFISAFFPFVDEMQNERKHTLHSNLYNDMKDATGDRDHSSGDISLRLYICIVFSY